MRKSVYNCASEMPDNHLYVPASVFPQFPDKTFFVIFSLTEKLNGTVSKQFPYSGDGKSFFVEDFLQ